jgi:hypothetical protein
MHGAPATAARVDARAKPVWARALAPLFLAPGLQAPQNAPAPPAALAPAAPAAEHPTPATAPYAKSVREGLLELRGALGAKQLDQAKSLGEALLAKPRLADSTRAEIEYHRGIVFDACSDGASSSAAFSRAGGLAAAGPLRLDAWYNAGTVDLNTAEQLFLQIPEVREARKLPPLEPAQPSAQANPASPAAEKNQDLDRAAAAFDVSKQGLLLRLRADWHDADTRANLELIQRRLRAITKIREEREKQEQEQKDQQQKQDPKQQDKDKNDKSKDKKDPSKPDDKSSDPDKSKPDDKQDPKEKPKPDEKKDPSKDPSKQDQPKPEDAQKTDKDPKSAQQAKPGDEQALSKEEVLRLMDQLQAIDQEARELQARIRAHRRPPVAKDW